MTRIAAGDDWSESELHRVLEREFDFAPGDIEVEIHDNGVHVEGTVEDWTEVEAVEEFVSNELSEEQCDLKFNLSVDSPGPMASNPPGDPDQRQESHSMGSGPSVRRQY